MLKQLETPTDAELRHVFGDDFEQQWHQQKVTNWLNDNGWSHIAPVFEDHGIAGKRFFQISLAELVNVLPRRITTYAERRRLLNDIRVLGLSTRQHHSYPAPGNIYINTDLHLFPSAHSSSDNASPYLPSADCGTPTSSHHLPFSQSPSTPSSAASKQHLSHLYDHFPTYHSSSPTSSSSLSPSPSSSDYINTNFRPLPAHHRQSPTKSYSPKAAFAKFRNAFLHRHDSGRDASIQHPVCLQSQLTNSGMTYTPAETSSNNDADDFIPTASGCSLSTLSAPENSLKLWPRHSPTSPSEAPVTTKVARIQITGDRDTWYSLNVPELTHAYQLKNLILKRMNLSGNGDDYFYFHENGQYPDSPLDDPSILHLCSLADKSATQRILITAKYDTLYSPSHSLLYNQSQHALSTPELGHSPSEKSHTSLLLDPSQTRSKWSRFRPLHRQPFKKKEAHPIIGIQLSDPPTAVFPFPVDHSTNDNAGCWAVAPKLIQSCSSPKNPDSTAMVHPLEKLPTDGQPLSPLTPQSSAPDSAFHLRRTLPKRMSVDYWGDRPPTEIVLQNMEKYFDDHDLDKEVVVTAAPLPALGGNTSSSSYSAEAGLPSIPSSATRTPQTMPRKGLRRHVKSIRVAAREASKKYFVKSPLQRDSQLLSVNSDHQYTHRLMVRRKSTKMWDQTVVEVKPEQRQRTPASPLHLTISTSADATASAEEPPVQWIRGKLIGKGSFGRVYLAFNVVSGDMIAVKQVDIPNSRCRDDRQHDMVDALYREIAMLRDLDHENIVQYLGYGVDEQEHIINIFLEYVSGGNVANRLALHGGFDEPVVRHFTRQICQGLAYLHHRHILHRDIKAANILVEADGVCKISDFGLSKKNDYDEAYDQNSRMSLRGSIYWMAPEVVKNEPYSAKVDIWSLGCTVLEMFTGQRPWISFSQIAALYNLGHSNAPDIPDTISDFGRDFITKCFNTDPNLRPTAMELLSHPFCAEDPGFNFEEYVVNDKV